MPLRNFSDVSLAFLFAGKGKWLYWVPQRFHGGNMECICVEKMIAWECGLCHLEHKKFHDGTHCLVLGHYRCKGFFPRLRLFFIRLRNRLEVGYAISKQGATKVGIFKIRVWQKRGVEVGAWNSEPDAVTGTRQEKEVEKLSDVKKKWLDRQTKI